MEDNNREKLGAFDPISFSIGQNGEMLTLPALVVWSVANTLKENFLDRYEPFMGVPTSEDPNPAPYFRLKEGVEDESLTEDPEVSFDDLYAAWKMVAQYEGLLAEMESTLDNARALFKQQYLIQENFWPGNRPPSMEYLKQVVHYIGNNKEQAEHLKGCEKTVEDIRKKLTEAKGLLDMLHWKLKVWQTKSANARKTLVE